MHHSFSFQIIRLFVNSPSLSRSQVVVFLVTSQWSYLLSHPKIWPAFLIMDSRGIATCYRQGIVNAANLLRWPFSMETERLTHISGENVFYSSRTHGNLRRITLSCFEITARNGGSQTPWIRERLFSPPPPTTPSPTNKMVRATGFKTFAINHFEHYVHGGRGTQFGKPISPVIFPSRLFEVVNNSRTSMAMSRIINVPKSTYFYRVRRLELDVPCSMSLLRSVLISLSRES